MAMNPQYQERLHEEISENLSGLEIASDEYNENAMTKCSFLDAVIKETLRK